MYQHIQRSPLHFLLNLIALGMLGVAWSVRAEMAICLTVVVFAGLMFVLANCFRTLTVTDGGDHLKVSFGPLGLFGTQIRYSDITDVEATQTSIIDGWGVHYIPFRGWTLNLWGFECAKVTQGNKVIRIGSDDSVRLVEYIQDRIPKHHQAHVRG